MQRCSRLGACALSVENLQAGYVLKTLNAPLLHGGKIAISERTAPVLKAVLLMFSQPPFT
jgi:hypothetical protein